MNERDLKLTDLDYAIADHHIQMLKAAIPYLDLPQQQTISIWVKLRELIQTKQFFNDNDLGMLSVCSLDKDHTTPPDMLEAVRPYANQKEQEMIDMLSSILKNKKKRNGRFSFSMDQILSIFPPEQQAKFETLQMMMQTINQI